MFTISYPKRSRDKNARLFPEQPGKAKCLYIGVFKFVLPVLIIIGVIILVVGIAKKASGSNRYDQQDYYSDYDRDSYQGPNQEYFQDQPQDYWRNKF